MKRIFEYFYPDHGGYTFVHVVVWQGRLELADGLAWESNLRILDARLVIAGQIIRQITDAANNDDQTSWTNIMTEAGGLKHDLTVELKNRTERK